MTTFFTADTHFGHAGIIKYAKRPFASPREMDNALMRNWNATVRPTDIVYHLGDFCFDDLDRSRAVFSKLNGRKHLVMGNHDPRGDMALLGWDSVSDYMTVNIDGMFFVMFHYPIVEWDRFFRNDGETVGSIDLFGHVHSTPDNPKHAWSPYQHDVGVDNNAYCPVSSAEVVRIVKRRARERSA